MQWNIRSINVHRHDLLILIKEKNPICICLNETFLENTKGFVIKGYTTYHTGSINQQGNLILVRKDIPFTPCTLRSSMNVLAVQIKLDQLLTICSIYLKPNMPIDQGKLNELISQLPQPFLLLGDFNARNTFWHDTKSNPRGNCVLDIILDWQLHILDDNTPTHYDRKTDGYSHIDLSVCTQDLGSKLYWSVYDDRCGSDHYPIFIEFLDFTTDISTKHFNYFKADWPSFYCHTEEVPSYDEMESVDFNLYLYASHVLGAAELNIPFSAFIKVKFIVPWWNDECKQAKKERSKANRKFKKTRRDADYIEYKRQCAITQRVFRAAQRNSWISYVSSINIDTPISKIWKKVHKILGKHIRTHVPTLSINNEIIYDAKDVATAFAENLSRISKGSSTRAFLMNKSIREAKPIDFSSEEYFSYNENFSMDELKACLADCSNTAPGEDNISFEMLKHVHENSLFYLLDFYNNLFSNEQFPQSWNTAIDLPFLKPGKNPHDPSSYRPIALTSCLCKLFEKMINQRLVWYLESRGYLSPSQYGYRKMRSTLDPLTILDADIGKAFAANEYITAIFFDLEKAYDTAWRYHILEELHSAKLKGHLPIAIQNFLSGREFKVKVNGVTSETFPQHEGVPQGSVLSTTLFILAINELVRQLPSKVQCSLYVDDFAIWVVYCKVHEGQQILQEAINHITVWIDAHGFTISATKTVAITFTKKRQVPNLNLVLNNRPVRFVTNTKFLGMYIDQRMSWKWHINYLRDKCNKVVFLLRKLSHTKWGSDRTTLLYLHKTLVLSVLDYGSHLYASASKSTLKKLDPIHNIGLRLATGAFKSSPVVSLYAETGFCSLDQRRVDYSLNYYSRVLRVPCKVQRLIDQATIPRSYGPRTFYPYVVRLKIFLKTYDVPPLKFIKHTLNSTPFWLWKRDYICKEMFAFNKKQIDPTIIKQLFINHQQDHADSIPIYTDGSKSDAGVGFAVVSSDSIEQRKMPSYSSVFSSELGAISLALSKIPLHPFRKYAVYTDSQSALQAIDSFNAKHPGVRAIQENIHLLHEKRIEVILCWSPGHVGIKGNESADRAAKAAALSSSTRINKCYYKDIKNLFQNKLDEKWYQEWSLIQNNKLQSIKSTIKPWSTAIQKNRSHEVTLCRLRIGHTRLTHGHLMANQDPPNCNECQTRLTVQHILLNCPKYLGPRRKYFGSSPELKIVLGDDEISIIKLFRFLDETDLFKEI